MESGEIGALHHLSVNLSQTPFPSIANNSSPYFFGVTGVDAELAARQFIASKRLGILLNKEILHCTKSRRAKLTLPKLWRDEVQQSGLLAHNGGSGITWITFVMLAFFYGILISAKIFFTREKATDENGELSAYVYGLNRGGETSDLNLNNFLDWYKHFGLSSAGIKSIFHNVKIENPTENPQFFLHNQTFRVPPLKGALTRFKFFCWVVWAIVVAVVNSILGKWWYPLMLSEAAYMKAMQLQPKERVPKQLLFNNSDFIYQPLFALEAQRRGANVALAYYSVNIELFPENDESLQQSFGWVIGSWKTHLVWTAAHQNYISNLLEYTPKFILSRAMPLADIDTPLPVVNGPTIAVFDMTAFRRSFYCLIGQTSEYYTEANVVEFWKMVIKAAREAGITLMIKRKRQLGSQYQTDTFQKKLKLLYSETVIEIDENVAAESLIDHCDGVVSIPFTSTSVIGLDRGKPSVYFDSTGRLNKPLAMDHGVPVLADFQKLKIWMEDLVVQKKC